MKIKKIELSEQEKKDILTDAYETDSIDYWVRGCSIANRDNDSYVKSFVIVDEDGNNYVVDGNTIQKGIDTIFSDGFDIADRIKQMIWENDNDADSCDCIIQAALFGKLVYG